MTDPRLAALWLHALQRLADRAAHELNNALNGVVVNVEVVRVRARPGEDGARAAPFAEAAVEQAEGATALAGALLALARSARPDAALDAAAVARHVATLLAPAVAHRGVRVWLEAAAPAPVDGDPVAVRTAVTLALLDAAAVAEGAAPHATSAVPAAELGGSNPADEPGESLRRVRCTVSSVSRATVRVEPSAAPSATGLDSEAVALLREAGVDVVRDGGAVTLTFRDAGREHTSDSKVLLSPPSSAATPTLLPP